MDILDIAIAKQLAGGGGGSGTDNYNDLSNLPKINDVTLSGNKTSANLGLQSEINSDSKLASDLIDDTNQDNKFVTSTEKNTWNAKQNAIDADHKLNADYVDDSTSTNKFVTASDKETWSAKQNAIDNSHKLSSDLVDDTNHTNKFVTSTEKNTWNGKQNAIDSDHKLSSSLVSFTTAEAAALASGINSTKVAQISTNQSNILSVADANGQKNLIFYDGFPKTEVGVTLSFDDNGGIELNGTCGGADDYAYIYGIYAYVDAGTVYSFIDSMYTGSDQYAFVAGSEVFDNPPAFISSVNNRTAKISDKVTIVIRLTKGITYNKTKMYPMLCAKSLYDISPSYQPYALPNYDLTYLQAEDRATLAEVVDSGAKNIAEIYNVTQNAITITTSGYKATFSGSASQDGSITWGKIHVDKTGDYVVYSNMSTSAGRFTLYNQTDSVILKSFYPLDNQTPIVFSLVAGKTYTVYSWFAAGTASACVIDLMICTKAAFGVSNKFVPYRPNYDLVVSQLRWIPVNVPQNGNDNYFGVIITGPNRGTYNINFMSNNGINGYGNIIISTIYTSGAWNVYVNTSASTNVTMKVYSISSTSLAIVFYAPNKWAGFTISGTDSNDQTTIYRSNNAPSWTEITQQAFPT